MCPQRKKDLLPKTLTYRECEARGWIPDDAERTLPGTFIRKDAFGLADIISIRTGGPGTLYIQATSWSNHAARRKKALESPNLRPLLQDGNRFVIWSWVCTRGEERLKAQEIALRGDMPVCLLVRIEEPKYHG